MRKRFYAGAAVGGLLLLGAAPARADVVPAPADGLLGSPGGGQGPDGALVPAEVFLGGGLLPDGGTAPAVTPRESALFDGGVPLLGGLGGLLPANEVPPPRSAAGDGTPSGMPAGGTAVDPAPVGLGEDRPGGPAADRAAGDPGGEPADGAGGRERTFSGGGRPVAGEDEDFR